MAVAMRVFILAFVAVIGFRETIIGSATLTLVFFVAISFFSLVTFLIFMSASVTFV
ncbi:MAG TPA: hypothetical protein VK097_01040 [Lentibacillus sp.]|uniref:hypothetical protein n=1 Tax=Lentibacillus sp. TaxID=1925746 RepID=UPI002B4B1C06|nr:hypothetical protein [Lentibacillus sp.]HLR61007.1 hypothetical protein [Lentibacillus sp.]